MFWNRPAFLAIATVTASAIAMSMLMARRLRGEKTMPLLRIKGLKKAFLRPDGTRLAIIDVAEFSLHRNQQLALRGDSGCGKTTFLHLIAGILKADTGIISLDGSEVSRLSESQRDRLRATLLGYVFQSFNLLQGYTCLENVLLGMSFGPGPDRNRARALLERVGLGNRLEYYPRQLSTGQQQRVAVARALANRPKLVLADEPSGNLDPKNARESLKLIRETCQENGAALLLVSHDSSVLEQFEKPLDFQRVNRASLSRQEGLA